MEKIEPIAAVQMVRRIRDAHHEALKGASREERIAFYNGTTHPSRPGSAKPAPRARKPAASHHLQPPKGDTPTA